MSPLRRLVFPVICLLASTVLARPGAAQCSEWDPSFRTGGFNSSVTKTIVYDDGTGPAVYAVGNFWDASGTTVNRIARWDGQHWAALPPAAGEPTDTLYALHVWDDGTGPALYVGGVSWSVAGVHSCVAKWNGSTWTGLANGPDSVVHVLEDFGGSLYAGGRFVHVGGQFQQHIARWNGTSWVAMPGFAGGAGPLGVFALQVFDDGNGPALYAGGQFENVITGFVPSIARWDGSIWSSVSIGFNGTVQALTVFDSGSGPALIAAGSFTQADGMPANRIAQWNGGSWSSLGSGVGGTVLDLQVHDDQQGGGPQLYAAGSMPYAGSVTVHNVARWNGSSWSAAGAGTDGTIRDVAVHDMGNGPRLIAVGDFEIAGSDLARRVASWDGVNWTAVEPNQAVLEGSIEVMTHFDDGHGDALYAAGTFRKAGNILVNSVARFDGASWTTLGSGTTGMVRALYVWDDGTGEQLYAGGDFTSIGGVATRGIARWNGTQWSALPGVDPFYVSVDVHAIIAHDDGTGPALYVGGLFYSFAFASGGVARWRNGTWSGVGVGLNGQPDAFAIHDDGSGPALYAAGYIQYSGSVVIDHLAKWDGLAWSRVGGGIPGVAPTVYLRSIVSFDDGTGPALYVGGRFANAGNIAASNVAKWKNGTWSAFGSGTSGDVLELAFHDDGTGHGPELYAAGNFATAGVVATPGIARWNGTGWSALDGGLDNIGTSAPSVRALATWNSGAGRDLYLGGLFDFAGTKPSRNIARWNGCGGTGNLYCFGDGSGAACPCGNSSAPIDQAGCASSIGLGATLRASGEPSLSGDSLVLHGGSMTNSVALYFQGAGMVANGAGAAFGDGLRCASGPFVRLGIKNTAAGASSYPAAGDASISTKGAIVAPGTRTYQARYRNSVAFCTSDTFNLTNGVEIVWTH